MTNRILTRLSALVFQMPQRTLFAQTSYVIAISHILSIVETQEDVTIKQISTSKVMEHALK